MFSHKICLLLGSSKMRRIRKIFCKLLKQCELPVAISRRRSFARSSYKSLCLSIMHSSIGVRVFRRRAVVCVIALMFFVSINLFISLSVPLPLIYSSALLLPLPLPMLVFDSNLTSISACQCVQGFVCFVCV